MKTQFHRCYLTENHPRRQHPQNEGLRSQNHGKRAKTKESATHPSRTKRRLLRSSVDGDHLDDNTTTESNTCQYYPLSVGIPTVKGGSPFAAILDLHRKSAERTKFADAQICDLRFFCRFWMWQNVVVTDARRGNCERAKFDFLADFGRLFECGASFGNLSSRKLHV